MVDDRTGRPEQVSAPAMRRIIKMIDMAIENGSLDPQDRDEVIRMFFSDPKLVLDNKAMGGMMNINDMIRPVSYKQGGPAGMTESERQKSDDSRKLKMIIAEMEGSEGPGEPTGIEKFVADTFPIDPRFTAKQRIKEILGMTQDTGGSLLDDVDDLRTMTKRYVLLKSLAESYGGRDVLQRMDDIKRMSPVEIEIEFQKLMGVEE